MSSIKKSIKEKHLRKLKLIKKLKQKKEVIEEDDESQESDGLLELAAENNKKKGKFRVIVDEDDNEQEENDIEERMEEEEVHQIIEEPSEEEKPKTKKKKRSKAEKQDEFPEEELDHQTGDIPPSEEFIVNRPYNKFTISIGFPDSVIQKCQSFELRNFMLSQLARIVSIHMSDEIIIIKDHSFSHRNKEFSSIGSLTKILQYLETPQYLRKALFPISQDLRYVGRLYLRRPYEPN